VLACVLIDYKVYSKTTITLPKLLGLFVIGENNNFFLIKKILYLKAIK